MAREARAVIIVHGHHTIRAGYGIHELFSTPTVVSLLIMSLDD